MASRSSVAPNRPVNTDIDNYDVDDDPFASSGDEAPKNDTQSKKRKDQSGLGIDEAVAVQKKARVPMVKLDEGRLLSEKGIPRLRRKARDLKFKGKGHEFSDAARLLSFYQLWFDDLFPKAKFLDAVAMAEKAGHKKYIRMKRLEWIDEGKPKSAAIEGDDDDLFGESNDQPEERDPAIFPARVAPIFQNQGGEKAQTPPRDDIPPDDEDIYDATPRAQKTAQPTSTSLFGGGGASTSLFGNGGEPDEDDLDALMAEEEAQRTKPKSLFGNGEAIARRPRDEPDEDDLDALMAEAEAEAGPPKRNPDPPSKPAQTAPNDDEGDDLDALMAEAENEAQSKQSTSSKPNGETDKLQNTADADEEEVMAEMDGLW
ncbi:Swi3-domain-containing protein [Hypoxylon trugodes]|uniref:Swi3-domain-containing protein n=1 Tax=Hypoxylon trugodes TaxID=326681 RepID=UPI00218CA99B|nr:Swi3-domain-containing protein [Hypoxylon trugodes]KAI1391865.1 Swi3-domain-containing protein [Hypoxylon trugodes]